MVWEQAIFKHFMNISEFTNHLSSLVKITFVSTSYLVILWQRARLGIPCCAYMLNSYVFDSYISIINLFLFFYYQ